MREYIDTQLVNKFVNWTKLKVRIHLTDKNIYFHEREIWWASLGMNIGYEENGKHENFERPVLIIKTFNRHICWILPMSTKNKDNPYYFKINYHGSVYSVILSQIKLISSRRLLRKIRKISSEEFRQIKQVIRSYI